MMCLWIRNLAEYRKSDVLKKIIYLTSFLFVLYPSSFSFANNDVQMQRDGNISISVQSTDLSEVYEMLSMEGNVNILLGSGVSGDVSVNLYDVTIEEAIRSIATAAGFAVEYTNGHYYIMPHDEAGKEHVGGITDLKTYRVQYTDPEQIADILNKHLSRYGKITALSERRLLVVEDLPDFLSRIEVLLHELDRQPKQILIEARVMEVALDDTETFGIDWNRMFTLDKDTKDPTDISFGIQGLATPGSPGFFFSLINPNITAALNALDAKGRVRTLSTPKLLALEHEEAEVIIGDRTGYLVTTTINQVTTESVAFLESGVILRVKSFVDQSGKIKMEIHPEVSTATVNNNIPSLSTTEVTTNFLADDGQTIFIAGLMRNSTSKRREGVPVLSDVPLIGKAFSNSEDITINTETVVMITPHIVEAGDDLFMIENASKVERVEKQLEEDRENVVEELEQKIGPVEVIESVRENSARKDLKMDRSLSLDNLNQNYKYELEKSHKSKDCGPIRSDSIYRALHAECSQQNPDNYEFEASDVLRSLFMLGTLL